MMKTQRHHQRRGAQMNQYGQQADAYWHRWLPDRYAVIGDTDAYFTALGEQVEERVGDLWDRLMLEDTPPQGESHADRVGRLEALKRQAEEIVLADLVLLAPEPATVETDQSDLETDEAFAARMADFDELQRWRSQTATELMDEVVSVEDLTDAQLRIVVEYMGPQFLLALDTSVDQLRARGRDI
jgi:hypothetical protein